MLENLCGFCGVVYDQLLFAITRKQVYFNEAPEGEEPVLKGLDEAGTAVLEEEKAS